ENILKGIIGHQSDRHFLWTMRAVVVCFTVAVTLFALNSNASIYEMVGNAYKVTLVAAFIPLVSGLYWKRANTQGALFAISAGISTWLLLEIFNAGGLWPPQLAGLLMSALGMLVGSLLPNLTRQQHKYTEA
ncbi:MAG: sodium:solute symporter, partial [Gallionellaceae bacterium]